MFTLEELKEADAEVRKSGIIHKTPVIQEVQKYVGLPLDNLILKLESMQNTGK